MKLWFLRIGWFLLFCVVETSAIAFVEWQLLKLWFWLVGRGNGKNEKMD